VFHTIFSPYPFAKMHHWDEELVGTLFFGTFLLFALAMARELFNRHYSRNQVLKSTQALVYYKFFGEYVPTRSRLEMRARMERLGFTKRYFGAQKELSDFLEKERKWCEEYKKRLFDPKNPHKKRPLPPSWQNKLDSKPTDQKDTKINK